MKIAILLISPLILLALAPIVVGVAPFAMLFGVYHTYRNFNYKKRKLAYYEKKRDSKIRRVSSSNHNNS